MIDIEVAFKMTHCGIFHPYSNWIYSKMKDLMIFPNENIDGLDSPMKTQLKTKSVI